MGRKKYYVKLSELERQELEKFVARGKKSVREVNRARVLLLDSEGKSSQEIAKILGLCRESVWCIRKKFCENRPKYILDFLKDEPRSGRPIKIDSRVTANITMIACSESPEGSSRWTLRMIADKLVKLEAIDSISHVSVGSVLKKTN